MSLIIAIDYDFTYTADHDLWDGFIKSAQSKGHKIICVTGRSAPPCKEREKQFTVGVEIICSGDLEKRKAAEQAGYKVNIWIDDAPETISPCIKLEWD